ncbi:hypothetical protein BJ508DRAFT_335261 [Ascobolus immersus RN42]|uniref:Uncharacterized protein n=1 Tax=Ascobolus immersus RN42 TaxID=1160509 RepID=A0A3N4HF54_ASCIM|nr:hypothetical protein BJ508DRAFT_335261 [Ascobolus immersus RN42]
MSNPFFPSPSRNPYNTPTNPIPLLPRLRFIITNLTPSELYEWTRPGGPILSRLVEEKKPCGSDPLLLTASVPCTKCGVGEPNMLVCTGCDVVICLECYEKI